MIISKGYQMEAFSEEAQVNRYLVFAKQAEKEGYPQIAQLFRATAQAEPVRAQAHLQALRRFRIARESLWERTSVGKNEPLDVSSLGLVATAAEGQKMRPKSLKSADGKEETSTSAYRKALARLAGMSKGDYYVCSECGFTCEGKRPEKCSHCRSKAMTLVKVG